VTAAQPARPGRLAVGLVGAGRAGSAITAALCRAGHRLVAVTSSSRSWPLLPPAPRLPADEVAAGCELLLLTVPDDALADLIRGLAVTGALREGQLVVHTSGRHGLGVLKPASDLGAAPLALHPVMTFTGAEADLPRLAGASIGVTTPERLRAAGELLALEMGGEPVWVPDAERPLWHAALAHGANHLVTLVGQAMDLLTTAGVEHPDRVLGPLLAATLDNTLRANSAALTGPVSRGDAATVAEHLRVLSAASPASTYDCYLALARATLARAEDAGRLRGPDAAALARVLGQAP
jgi:predicted short-subunit dehydrogenase-like oxidoreductase (DUF2520 family)